MDGTKRIAAVLAAALAWMTSGGLAPAQGQGQAQGASAGERTAKPASRLAAPPGRCEVRQEDVAFFKDQGLTMKLASRLQFNKTLLLEGIEARVSGGVAILRGGVSSPTQAQEAVRIARETEGIRCVIDEMDVPGRNPR